MIPYDSEINKEIVTFIRACTNDELPIYNASMLMKPPKEKERIEFTLDNFVSTGQIYRDKDVSGFTYELNSIAEYRCQLIITVFKDALGCAEMIGKIAGAIQTFDYMEQYVHRLYVENQTMYVGRSVVNRDNMMTNFQEIIVDCYVGLEYKNNIDFFDKLKDVVYIIE